MSPKTIYSSALVSMARPLTLYSIFQVGCISVGSPYMFISIVAESMIVAEPDAQPRKMFGLSHTIAQWPFEEVKCHACISETTVLAF